MDCVKPELRYTNSLLARAAATKEVASELDRAKWLKFPDKFAAELRGKYTPTERLLEILAFMNMLTFYTITTTGHLKFLELGLQLDVMLARLLEDLLPQGDKK